MFAARVIVEFRRKLWHVSNYSFSLVVVNFTKSVEFIDRTLIENDAKIIRSLFENVTVA